MPLTDSSIRGLKPRETRYTKADGGGLSIEVLPSGKKVFKLAYRYGRQQRNRTLGPFPMLRLANARIMREKVKESLMLGRDPDETDVETLLVEPPDNSDRTWRVLCEAFLEKMALEGSNPRTVAAIRNKLEKTWPTLGDKVGDEIDPPDLLAVCKEVEAKGNYETANRIRSAAGRVCRYAMASGLMTRNFSDGLQGALVQPQKQGFPAITEPHEVGELLRAVWDYNGPSRPSAP